LEWPNQFKSIRS